MSITIEKLEGKEDLMKVLDMLSGGEASQHVMKLREAKSKMEAAGFSDEAMAALSEFAVHVEELARVTANAITTANQIKNYAAGEFALAGLRWLEVGLNNCHDMLEKADVDPDLFGLRPRRDGYAEVLRMRMREIRAGMREHIAFTVTDSHDNTTTLSSATWGEAASEALVKLGYTLTATRK